MRKCRPLAWLALGAAATLFASATPAQEDVEDSESIGGARIRGDIRALAYYTDNFYNQSNSESSGYGSLISPEFTFLRQTAKLEFAGGVRAEYGVFNLPGAEDDYLDGSANLRFAVQPSLRNNLRLDGGFKRGHDPFGVDRTEDATVRDTELDLWNHTTAALRYRYGAPGARVTAGVGLSGMRKHYTTNRAATEVLDYDTTTFDYTLSYNYSPKTAALVDFSRTDFSFDRHFGPIDARGGELYRARVGLRWLATGKTSGDVRVGYRRRLFEASSDDIEAADWEAGIDWAPAPRTSLRLETARSEQVSYTATARVIDIQSVALDWKYNLTARTRAGTRLERILADFEGAREDEISNVAVSLEHLAMSYLWLVGSVGMTERDSTVSGREYDRVTGFVGVRWGL